MAEISEIQKLKAELEVEKKKSATLEKAVESSKKKIEALEKGIVPSNPNMVQYHVKEDCYWNEVFYYADDIAELPEGLTPPARLFEKVVE